MSENVKPPLAASTLAFLEQDQPASTVLHEMRGDRDVSYITISTAITLANHAFGIGGWSTKVINIEPVRNDNDRVLGYAATVRVTVHENGAQYEDVGTNSLDGAEDGRDRNPNSMEAHDIARKGAVSDALKRCLRHLGPMMGNNLYERSRDRADVANAALDRLAALIGDREAENIVFGAKYQRTGDIPIHAGLKALFHEPASVSGLPAQHQEPASERRLNGHDHTETES